MPTDAPLAELCSRILGRNPFTDNRVNAPSEEAVDVPSLHAASFERLTGLAREALHARRGIGVMLWGEAGIGKSHLLGRLDRWARTQEKGCSIYLHNLQASPANLPRTLLRSVVDALTWTGNDNPGQTELFGMLHEAAQRALGLQEVKWSQVRQGLLTQLAQDGPADATLADQTVIDVLYRFYRSVHLTAQKRDDLATARAALRWLHGDAITAEQALLLGLPPGLTADGAVAVEDAQQIKQILAILTRLAAACDRPFLLLFDQVDNLEPEQAAALSRFLEALIDSARNLLVVTAGIQHTMMGWRQQRIIQDSAWDRLAQVQIQLLKLSPGQARQLLEHRLQHFFQGSEEVAEVRRLSFDDSLFPLARRWFESRLGEQLEVRPREVISLAGEAWYREQRWLAHQGSEPWLAGWKQRVTLDEGLTAPVHVEQSELDDLIDRAIHAAMVQYTNARRGQPPDRDSLVDAIAELLSEHRRVEPSATLIGVQRVENASRSPYDLILLHQTDAGAELTTGLVLAASMTAYQMAPLLLKLGEDVKPPRRVLLVCNEQGPSLGTKGEEYLDKLKARPNSLFEMVPTPAVELNTLDALHAVWNLARSEDVEVTLASGQKRPVGPDEVIGSHRRACRFAASSVLAAALSCPPPAEPFPPSDLNAELALPAESVLAVAAVAQEEPALAATAAWSADAQELALPAAVAEGIPELEVEEAIVDLEEAVMDLEEAEAEPTEVVNEDVLEESIDEILFGNDSGPKKK